MRKGSTSARKPKRAQKSDNLIGINLGRCLADILDKKESIDDISGICFIHPNEIVDVNAIIHGLARKVDGMSTTPVESLRLISKDSVPEAFMARILAEHRTRIHFSKYTWDVVFDTLKKLAEAGKLIQFQKEYVMKDENINWINDITSVQRYRYKTAA